MVFFADITLIVINLLLVFKENLFAEQLQRIREFICGIHKETKTPEK